ncbi:MAG: hypothetical protein HUJ71_08275 [Pseudobutyrivibrio sp.]|nr:hypothetical protein [Pseudobutyrivibrio sp.]
MKKIILINSMTQLIVAVAIREKMYMTDEVDLIVASRGGLEKANLAPLNDVFDHIYKADYAPTKANRAVADYWNTVSLMSPDKYLKKVLGYNFEQDYDDIFFWNPTMVAFTIIRSGLKKKKPLTIHLFADSLAGCYTDYPVHHLNYKKKWMNDYNKSKYGLDYVRNLHYDYYIWKKDLHYGEIPGLELVEIPQLDPNDSHIMDILNDCFNYNEVEIPEKYIYLDRPFEDGWDEARQVKMLDALAAKVGAENIAIKKHPRSPGVYEGYRVIKESFPWELYRANNPDKEHVLITSHSAVTLMPYLIFGIKQTIYYLGSEDYNRNVPTNNFYETYKQFEKRQAQIQTMIDIDEDMSQI